MNQDNLIENHLRFIKDVAADEDFFGTHQRIAEAVSNVVRNYEDFRVLGLIGPWGSGKSTVIRLTQRILEADKGKETQFFIYDAWLHQSEPFNIAITLGISRDQPVELGQPLFDALSEAVPELLATSDTNLVQRWMSISSLLKSNSHHELFKVLRDQMLRPADIAARNIILNIGGDTLLNVGHFDEEADDAIRYLVTPMLGGEEGVVWILEKTDRVDRWFKQSKPESRGFFAERLAERWLAAEEQQKLSLEFIGTALDLDSMTWKKDSTQKELDRPTSENPEKLDSE